MLSILMPARNEIYLEKTLRNILDKARGELEILVALDGWLPEPQIHMNDDRVIFQHYPKSIGQRAAINELARMAKGEFVMKLDAHSAVDEGFDVKLAADCEYEWTVVPRMYNLDVETWKPKLHKRTDYMYIGGPEDTKTYMRALYYEGKLRAEMNAKAEQIDDTMCCMGPGWAMRLDRFWELGGCDEAHGSWGQQGVEVALKAWLSGGSLKVNKKTWFAHWFRGGGGPGFPYPMSGKAVDRARKYSRELWLNNKFPKQVRDFQWLINRFRPPGWPITEENVDMNCDRDALQRVFYKQFHLRYRDPMTWRGRHILKLPTDMMLYAKAIWQNKPDFIIETGTKFGGTSLFLADMCELNGKGQVITVDINYCQGLDHPRLHQVTGSSIDRLIIAIVQDEIKKMAAEAGIENPSIMVVLDSNHQRGHVKWELYHYSQMVTPGQFLVVEDCYNRDAQLYDPGQARDWFLRTRRGREFTLEPFDEPFLVGLTRKGWLKRK